ncbi:PHD-finger protein [Quillaja saponaria]|uniref:PHD-finger protein n=1 Tax=Quillaja saponaria TaxID=32244 RepID=A0AAD7PN73_QUISA|nr:PHD-finger protein [Quillaja saponaria]
MCPKCDKYPHDWCRKAKYIQEDKKHPDDLCCSNCPRSLCQQPMLSTMTESTVPNIVYKRRKLRENSNAPVAQGPMNMQRTADCLSVISSSVHLSSANDQQVASQLKHEIQIVKDPVMPPLLCKNEPCVSKSEFVVHNGATKNSTQFFCEIDSLNDSCSSSKSKLVSDFRETEMDETGECSSSSIMGMDIMSKDLSGKDFCIHILRSEGLLGGAFHAETGSVGGDTDTNSSSFCFRSCKICGHLDTSLNLLICDNCEKAFHPSCFGPRFKKLPVDEWFCHSCLKKKRKILKEKIATKPPSIIGEMERCREVLAKGELNPIELMLKDTEPYTTSVRVGKGFQADVPDWSGPLKSDDGALAELLEQDPSETMWSPRKPSRLSSIGNWLQCQQVSDGAGGANGTICGKWRRAPLFEVQSGDWECFCAVHWDPAHADCAVPQELETDRVLKQLKYIEMLRPQLNAKQRKSECSKAGQ